MVNEESPTSCLSVFDHFVGLALIGLNKTILQIGSKLKLLFLTAIWLPRDRLWAIIEGSVSISQL